ncbi:MAG: hypothetical protein U0360_00980 [Dehalococcoidia bacterium]
MHRLLQSLAQAFLDGMTLMALADDEYWLARQYHTDPEAARLLPWLGDTSSPATTTDVEADWAIDARDALAEVEAIFADESRDLAVIG